MGSGLNDMMQMDHVVRVMANGDVLDGREVTAGIYAPEIHMDADWDEHGDAHTTDAHEKDMVEHVRSQGWTVFTGHVTHGLTLGPVIDGAYSIGGNLEDHIRTSPGFWVACVVDVEHPDDENGGTRTGCGWLLAHRPTVHYGESRTACGDAHEEEECTTTVKDVNCAECRNAVHRSV